ncbi:MAG: dUTP diphosphatase, partial [Candidatus Cloacimonetes bacterium]|nr:dUTP diphosphatase [Candidatus Cloacimonadota bacterium]
RGEIMVIIINLSNENVEINNGDRICQMVINRYEKASFKEAKVLNKTKRGKGGFGHTGSK